MRQGRLRAAPARKLSAAFDNSTNATEPEEFNDLIGPRRLDTITVFRSFQTSALDPYDTIAGEIGAETLLLAWRPVDTLSAVLDGSRDAVLLSAANEFKAYEDEIIIRLGHEFNGTWELWGNGKESAANFILGWKYVVNFMITHGVTNVKWCWNPNIWGFRGSAIDPTPFWPGKAYVNYVGLDGYMRLIDTVGTFKQLFMPNYGTLEKLSGGLPFIIPEVGVAEDPRFSKAGFFTGMFEVIRTEMPLLRILSYWHRNFTENGEGDMTVDSSGTNEAARQAFQEGVNSPPFTALDGGLTLKHEDNMVATDQTDVWGLLQAQTASRITLIKDGTGDPRPKGNGAPQLNSNFRRLELISGDRFQGTERTELGANESRYGTNGGAGTFMLFKEGDRRVTYHSFRLAPTFPIANINWQIVMQMKQTQPYNADTSGKVILELGCRNNEFQILVPPAQESEPLAVYKASVNKWIRFRWEVFYSPDFGVGWVELQIDDRAGATTFIPQWSSGKLFPPEGTLTKAAGKQSGAEWAYEDGDAIPSHLRLGIYRNPVISTTTYIDIGNVQTYA